MKFHCDSALGRVKFYCDSAVDATWEEVCSECGSVSAESIPIEPLSGCGQCFLQASAATSGKIGLMAHWDASSKPAILERRGVHSIHQGADHPIDGASVGRWISTLYDTSGRKHCRLVTADFSSWASDDRVEGPSDSKGVAA